MNEPHAKLKQPTKLEYQAVANGGNSMPTRMSAERMIVLTLVVLGCIAVLISMLAPSISRSRYSDNRVRCAANLRQIGQACMMYADADPQGRFPGRFEDLLLTQDITSEVFICPESDDERAVGPTTQAAVAQFSTPGHLSYIYVGSELTTKDLPDSTLVVAYEPLKNHHGNGMNVLFADGHVEVLPAVDGKALSAVAPPAAGRKITWDRKAFHVLATQPSGG